MMEAADRWRLVLGQSVAAVSGAAAARAAVALDELYGAGRGEGSGSSLDGGGDARFPSVREWSGELGDLFGETVREEVLGEAAGAGSTGAALELDPESVTPSVELLETVLSLKGALPEQRMARLRRIADRAVAALVDELAVRVRQALTGAVAAQPTRRPGGPLDLRRTVAANLHTARRRADGTPYLVPEELVFRMRTRRSLDWRVILVVDVSGSMEASVVHGALMAAILNGLPALSTHFVAFSDRVVDLSERVDDPLGLLLEVEVGGGTDIAAALRYARGLLAVPRRTMVVVVTDFGESGAPGRLLAEVRAIAESGARPLGLAALDDRGAPRYEAGVARAVVAAGMPVAALTPLELARWVGEQIR
jgi:uncharacterized protein with von Willebrand factor type A (vWA) domain